MSNTSQGYVEVTFIGDLQKSIDKKLRPLTKDEEIKYELAGQFAEYANMYVPRSNKRVSHHLQDYSVQTRGRIRWYRRNKAGEPIASSLYEGPMKGQFHRRAEGATSKGSHKVRNAGGHWDEIAKNTKSTWSAFCKDAKTILKSHL